MKSVKEIVGELKIVPVVKLTSPTQAKPLAKALIDGGLPIAEITFRTDAAEESIRLISEAYPEMCVGAGTVINKAQAETAVAAGAKFLVSPGFSPAIAEYAQATGTPYFPGTCTPTEIMAALEYGLDVMKFFPAKQYGGLATVKALAAPFAGIKFMPTGGVNAGNIKEFLECDKIIACGGTWMVDSRLIEAGDYEAVTALVKEAVGLVKEIS